MKSIKLKTQQNSIQGKLHALLQHVFSTDHYKIDMTFHTPTHWAQVYKITLYEPCDRTYIVRVMSHVHSTLEDRQKEILLTQQMSDLGIAPKVYYGNPYQGVLVMEYVTAHPLEGNHAGMALQSLAHKLKKVHGLDVRPYRSLGQDKIEGLLHRVASVTKSGVHALYAHNAKPSKFAIFEQALKAYTALQKILEADISSARVLCHLDLNKTNLLFDGPEAWIIDWDLADQGDVYLDLATVINTLGLTAAQETYFLQAYFNKPLNDLQRARLHVSKQLSYLRYALATFGLCTAYKPLPVAQTLMSHLQPPFVFPSGPALSKNMALYRLSLAFYKAAKTHMCDPQFIQALEILNHQEPIHEHLRSFCNH